MTSGSRRLSARKHHHPLMRPHRCRVAIGSVLMAISLTPCQSQPRLAYTSATPDDEPPKRVSSCGYTIGFSENSTAITSTAHDMLQQAVSEARRRKTSKVTVSAHYGHAESGAFQDRRAQAIANDLKRLGFTDNEISVGHTYDLPPTQPDGYVFVCDLADEKELQKTPPSNPNQEVAYKVGAAELHIPLRYLSPYDWRDVPIEPRNWGPVSLYFGWPGLQDRMSEVMQQCTRIYLNGCDDRVLVEVMPAGMRQSDTVLRQLPNRSELVPIRGQLYGGTWFAYKNWERRVQAVVQAQDEDGSPFVVSCRWFDFNKPAPDGWQPSLEGVKALAGTSRSYCQMVFTLSPAIDATVTFGGKNIADWRAIRSAVRDLVTPWEVPSSSTLLH
jgi:hypothetical protein